MLVVATLIAAIGCVLDVLSSATAMRAGAVEAVPLSRVLGPSWWWVRALATAAVTVGVWLGFGARWALLAVGVASVVVSVNNYRVANRLQDAARAAGPGASASSTGAGRGDTASSGGARP